MVQAVSHPGLRSEMDDDVWRAVLKRSSHCCFVLDLDLMHAEIFVRGQAFHAVALERDIVIRSEAVDACDVVPFFCEPQRQFAANEAGGAGDEDFHACALFLAPGLYDRSRPYKHRKP